jgi:hypothetical protein
MKHHQLSPVKIPLARLATSKVPFTAGIFILYRTNMGAPAFIGRSDIRLYDALNDYVKSPHYHYFKFMQCSDAADAYQWQCMFWHKGLATIDNAAHHPHPPRGTDLSCPYPGCSYVHVPAPEHHHETVEEGLS